MGMANADADADDAVSNPGKWVEPCKESWFFRGEDRLEWPLWARGHNGTAVHYPYGFDAPAYLTCRNKSSTTLAPPNFWVILHEDDHVSVFPPKEALEYGYAVRPTSPER